MKELLSTYLIFPKCVTFSLLLRLYPHEIKGGIPPTQPGKVNLDLSFTLREALFDRQSKILRRFLSPARSIHAPGEDPGGCFKIGQYRPTGIGLRIFTDEEAPVPLNGSQTSDALDIKQLIAKVPKAVRYACRFYGYQVNPDEVEDLSKDIHAKLFKDDGRVLRSFANRSSIDTWLYKVVRRELRPYLLKRRWEKENLSNVDDLSPETLRYEANQEERLIYEEKRKTLRAIISRLPDRKRRLVELDIQELKSDEIAKEMGIKIESVYRQKSATLKEIQRLIEGGGFFETGRVINFREIFFGWDQDFSSGAL